MSIVNNWYRTMKTQIITTLATLGAITGMAQAHIGDDEDQARARYPNATANTMGTPVFGLMISENEWNHSIIFDEHGKSVFETWVHGSWGDNKPITDADIEKIKSEYGMTGKGRSIDKDTTRWETSNGSIVLQHDERSKTLTVETAAHAKEVEREPLNADPNVVENRRTDSAIYMATERRVNAQRENLKLLAAQLVESINRKGYDRDTIELEIRILHDLYRGEETLLKDFGRPRGNK
jgi:hypothetical protein